MSQLREEILDDIKGYLIKWSIIEPFSELDQDKPFVSMRLSPEQEGRLIVYLEEKWNIRFEDVALLKEQGLPDLTTIADLITIMIKLMNDVERNA